MAAGYTSLSVATELACTVADADMALDWGGFGAGWKGDRDDIIKADELLQTRDAGCVWMIAVFL